MFVDILYICTVLHLRYSELEDVADGLLEDHDDGHLDEQVCQTPAGVALE